MMTIFKQLCCTHNKKEFVRNIYGDEIIECEWKRSIWRCEKCGKLTYGSMLNTVAPEFNRKGMVV